MIGSSFLVLVGDATQVIYGPSGWASVMVSPLPCSGVMLCSKCPLTIPGRRSGRRYRLPGGVIVSPLRSKESKHQSKHLYLSKHPSNTLCE